MTGKIFINYRRGDEPGFTQALLGRLEQAFPTDRLFIDVDSIPPGEDFARMLESQVAQCDAMLAIIGNGWLDATDERGNRRLLDPNDFVRIEIESALRQGKRVIPVLVHEARMPRADELPEAIRSLATRNAVRLTHERFRADVQGLVRALQGALDQAPTKRSRGARSKQSSSVRWSFAILGGLCVVGVGAVSAVWLLNSGPKLGPQQTALTPPVTMPMRPVQPTNPQAPPVPNKSAPLAPAESRHAQPASSPTPAAQKKSEPLTPSESTHAQPAPARIQAPLAKQAAKNVPPPQSSKQVSAPVVPDAADLEVTFWNSIKDQKNPLLFEAYLKRYPHGAFADIARIILDGLKNAAPTQPTQQSDDSLPITDALLIDELRDRLYELNFDPGPVSGPLVDADRQAIKQFQQQRNLPATGIATMGLLKRLREIGHLKPWGSIVYDKANGKWGMAWDEGTRKAAVARARASCGDRDGCSVEVSFFGTDCGAFAYSATGWSIVARNDIATAKGGAIADCRQDGKSCQVVATVCANGAYRFTAK